MYRLLLEVIIAKSYVVPAVKLAGVMVVIVIAAFSPASNVSTVGTDIPDLQLMVNVPGFPLTSTPLSVILPDPVLVTLTTTVALAQLCGSPRASCSVDMNENDSAPIHAATAMLTATVTAMSMIEATTGLRAFLLLNIFIFFHIPPFGVSEYVSRSYAFKSYDSIHHITQL